MKVNGIKGKLYLMILIILIPMVIVQACSIYIQYNNAIQTELEANYDFTHAQGLIIGNYINSIECKLYTIGTTIVGSPQMTTEEINSYLDRESTLKQYIINIIFVRPDGIVLADSLKESVGKSTVGRDYHNRILAGEDLAVSDVLIGRTTNESSIAVARAIRDGKELLGIMVASLNLDFLESVMPERRISNYNYFGLADKNGIIVYRNGKPNISRQMIKLSPDSPARKVLDYGESIKNEKFISTLTNRTVLGVALPITKLGWVAYANTDYHVVKAKAFDNIKYNVLIMIVTSIMSLTIALKVSKRIIEPINTLQYFAQEVSKGNLAVRANITGTDELAQVSSTLDQMAECIQKFEDNRRVFLQTAAHELKNPVTSIKGMVFLLERIDNNQGLQEKRRQLLETLEKEVDRLSNLINSIVMSFKAQHEKHISDLNLTPINLIEIVESVIKPYQMSEEKEFILFKNKPYKPLFILGDFSRLEDVLRNIIDNAIKYSPEKCDVTVEIKSDQKYATITICDKGRGIPEEKLEDIFNSFFRVQNGNEQDPGGLGLGLFLSREIIMKHSGRIWAINNQDVGSTFYIELPLII